MSNQTWKDKFFKTKQAYLNKDFESVNKYATEAKNALIESGFVYAEPLFKWIEKEWLDKGLSLGVIVYKDGLYYPVIHETVIDETTGYRGRTPITEKKIKIDASGFFAFLYEYELFGKI